MNEVINKQDQPKKAHKVLVIEDDPLILNILTNKFSVKGWDVTSVMSGEEGLKEAQNNIPDLILLDILLPGISGWNVLEALKKSEALRNVPVIVLSNYGQADEIEKSRSLGAIDHLIKANVILDEVISKSLLAVNSDIS